MSLTDFLLARIAEDEAEIRDHLSRDPWAKKMLADCEAKRRIEEEHGHCGCRMVHRLLAVPYADHPDFREEWRP